MGDNEKYAQLDRMIALAKRLGFWDDVAHWEAEKRRLKNTNDENEGVITDGPK